MATLLIWNEIPDNVRYFVIDDPTEAELEALRGAHDKYVNSTDESDQAVAVSQWILTQAGDTCPEFPGYDEAGKWGGLEKTAEGISDRPFDRVFVSGFML